MNRDDPRLALFRTQWCDTHPNFLAAKSAADTADRALEEMTRSPGATMDPQAAIAAYREAIQRQTDAHREMGAVRTNLEALFDAGMNATIWG